MFLFLGFYQVWGQQYQDDQQTYSSEQEPQKGFQKEKLFWGGNLGLSFGSVTYINVSPLVGYRFSDMASAGVQINGVYESVKYGGQKDKYGLLGVGVFGRFYPISQFFLHVQPEVNFVMGNTKNSGGGSTNKYHRNSTSFLVGGGYSQPIGGNSAFVIMVLYDVLQGDYSPYGDQPIFRVGVNLGF